MIEMAYAFFSGLYQVFTWSTFSLMLIGIFVGFWVGILPGLGGPTTLETVGVTLEERLEEEKGALRFWDICLTGFLVVILAGALWQSRDFGYRAGLFPWVIGFPVLALAIAQLGLELAGKIKRVISGEGDVSLDLPGQVIRSRTVSIISWILGFLIAIWLLGFSLAVPVTTLLYLKIASREKWPITIAITLISWGFFYGLFDYALDIPFPEGQIFAWVRL